MICPSCRSRLLDAPEFCKQCGNRTFVDDADTDEGPFALSEADWKVIADEFR